MYKVIATSLRELREKMYGRKDDYIYIPYSLKREIDTMPMPFYIDLIEELKTRRISLICENSLRESDT